MTAGRVGTELAENLFAGRLVLIGDPAEYPGGPAGDVSGESQRRVAADRDRASDATLMSWLYILERRDIDTKYHSERAARLTVELGRAWGLDADALVHVRRGALLHDIGKVVLPDRILLKGDRLTEAEWTLMRQHPVYAYEMLRPNPHLRAAIDIPYCHHEKWDGSGYPRGLTGHAIPLAARIFTVVDVWDALRSDRPYRPAWSAEAVFEYIRSLAGRHFDPQVVEAFFHLSGLARGNHAN